jgi:hypothetical protein
MLRGVQQEGDHCFKEPVTTEALVKAFGMVAVLSLDDFYAAPEEHVAGHARDISVSAGLVISEADIALLGRGQNIVNSPSAPVASWKELIQHKWPAYHGHLVSALEERDRMVIRGELKLEELTSHSRRPTNLNQRSGILPCSSLDHVGQNEKATGAGTARLSRLRRPFLRGRQSNAKFWGSGSSVASGVLAVSPSARIPSSSIASRVRSA